MQVEAPTARFLQARDAVLANLRNCVAGGNPPPSHEEVAQQLGVHTETVRKALQDLHQHGVLKLERQHSQFRYVVEGVATRWRMQTRRMEDATKTADWRKCLRCGKRFWSSHRGNRLCGCAADC